MIKGMGSGSAASGRSKPPVAMVTLWPYSLSAEGAQGVRYNISAVLRRKLRWTLPVNVPAGLLMCIGGYGIARVFYTYLLAPCAKRKTLALKIKVHFALEITLWARLNFGIFKKLLRQQQAVSQEQRDSMPMFFDISYKTNKKRRRRENDRAASHLSGRCRKDHFGSLPGGKHRTPQVVAASRMTKWHRKTVAMCIGLRSTKGCQCVGVRLMLRFNEPRITDLQTTKAPLGA